MVGLGFGLIQLNVLFVLLSVEKTVNCRNIRGHIPRPCLPHHRKLPDTASIRRTLAISLTESVFLRSSRNFCRVICLQDHSMFRQEAAMPERLERCDV